MLPNNRPMTVVIIYFCVYLFLSGGILLAQAPAPSQVPSTTNSSASTSEQATAAQPGGTSSEELTVKLEDVSLPIASQREKTVYHTFGRRDPFKSLVEKGMNPGENRPPGPAGMSISELSLKGILNLPRGRVAVFEGSDGKAYQLREGDNVFDGKVVQVGENNVIFEKIILDPFGREKEKKLIEVKLHM